MGFQQPSAWFLWEYFVSHINFFCNPARKLQYLSLASLQSSLMSQSLAAIRAPKHPKNM